MEPQSLRTLIESYAAAWGRGDRDGWLATFAPDATQEDPVGEAVRRGHDAIGEFWDRAMDGRDSLEIRPRAIHVTGREAAMEWRIIARRGDEWTTFDGVDVFTFTDGPLIATVRAYWDRSTFRVVRADDPLDHHEYEIVPFAVTNLGGVLSLCEAEGWPSFPQDPQRAVRLLTAPGVTSVVARTSDWDVIGFAQLFSDGELQAFLPTLAVAAAWRGRGVGQRLVRGALLRAGGERVDLLSEEPAAAFYESFPHRRMPGFRLYPCVQDVDVPL